MSKNFTVTLSFKYEVDPLDDDPEDIFELAEQERVELYRQLLGVPGVDEETIRINIQPIWTE